MKLALFWASGFGTGGAIKCLIEGRWFEAAVVAAAALACVLIPRAAQ